MDGLVLDGLRRVSFRTDLPDPTIEQETDAVVEVRRAGLCGSDLHPYEGRERVRFGVVPGHEVVGVVVRTGAAVGTVDTGDRVVVPFTTSCGRCGACVAGLSARCEAGQLFGYGPPDGEVPALHGGQAAQIRVPLADTTLVPVPPTIGDEEAVLLADNAPTAWYAVERADVEPGRPAAVVGLGAVGLCAVAAALAIGASPVIGVEPVPSRRQRAAALGAVPVHPDDAVAAIHGLRVASVIEAAGTGTAQELAFALLVPGGTLSVIAVQTAAAFGFTPVHAYDRNLTVRVGRAPVRSLLGQLLPRVVGRELRLPVEEVVTHPRVPLQDGPATYERFAAREDGLVKAAFVP